MILTRLCLRTSVLSRGILTRRYLTTAKSDPLRILFCGADEFSCAALEALDAERRADGVVESLDVVVRPGKGVGRGYKTIREGKTATFFILLNLCGPVVGSGYLGSWLSSSRLSLACVRSQAVL